MFAPPRHWPARMCVAVQNLMVSPTCWLHLMLRIMRMTVCVGEGSRQAMSRSDVSAMA